jgi:hypothetical protein
MALWRDPLDELTADLERTLPPVQSTGLFEWTPPGFPRDPVELQRMVREIMKSSPRVPLGPDPSDDREAADHHKGSKPTQ